MILETDRSSRWAIRFIASKHSGRNETDVLIFLLKR